MYFTYFLISWTFWTFPVKSQIYPKSMNSYERMNGLARGATLKIGKQFSNSLKIYPDNQFSMIKRSRNRYLKTKPQRQRHVLYYPPPKTYHYPYADRFKNFYKNPGFHNYNYFNNYRDNNNNNNNKDEKQKNIIDETKHNESDNNIDDETRVNIQKKKPSEYENFLIENVNSLMKNKNSWIKNGNLVSPTLKHNRNSLMKNGDLLANHRNSPFKNGNSENFFIKNGKLFYPPVPKKFMEPPGHATSDYRLYKRPEKNLQNIQKNNNEFYKNHNFYKNHKMNDNEVKNSDRTPYIRDHAPENINQELSEDENVANETEDEDEKFPKKITNVSGISPDGDRVEFQIQGHEGPRTYVFGYDTGEGSNRQYRLEEKLKDGTVKGQYGYYDARGKLRSIKYVAKPSEGYQEQHHSSPEILDNDEKEKERKEI